MINVFIILSLLLTWLSPSGLWAEGYSSLSTPNPEVVTCEDAREVLHENCERAAHYCTEVQKYDAYNQIKACAHYAAECNMSLQQVEEYCFSKTDSPHQVGHLH